ncbi:MAG: UDP-diphosphatase [Desulfobacterales bacterium]|nr:MAG: UDP-diphosphatase [Desulfobacterales bacterium]
MTGLQAAVLGFVQGLTEFLPVSSSGHLVLGQYLFGLREAALFFDISVHMGTLAAVILYFRKDTLALAAGAIRLTRYGGQAIRKRGGMGAALSGDDAARTAAMILAGSLPTALIGLALHRYADTLFASTTITGVCLILTAGILGATWRRRAASSDAPAPDAETGKTGAASLRISLPAALLIGVVQGLAVFPGISRSGATIAAGLFLGLSRDAAARFSFLLSIPAIAGAQVLGLADAGNIHLDSACLTGPLVAAVTGYAALVLLVYMVKKGRLHYFAPYCLAAGIFALSL